MSSSRITISAQFGGQDAADTVLPHFRALKAAERQTKLEGFPFKQLAFILRVDGEVSRYGLSGVGNMDIDKKEGYLSLDIGITHRDRNALSDLIVSSISNSANLIQQYTLAKGLPLDCNELKKGLSSFIERYVDAIQSSDASEQAKMHG